MAPQATGIPGPERHAHGEVCPEHTYVEQYELGADPPLGSFRMAGYPGARQTATVPGPRDYSMGPQTESVMTEHFVVATDAIYGFAWNICQGQLSRKDPRHGQCRRELIWRAAR